MGANTLTRSGCNEFYPFRPVSSGTRGSAGDPRPVLRGVKDGKLVYQTFQGAADLESGRPIREDTVFRIYSMTKPFTVVAALQLYEQGKFDLQDPISNFLPEFKETKVFRMGLPA